jgi:carbonic anhydrase/acetyltransferase-like protein (isoleucine patch superfamily)
VLNHVTIGANCLVGANALVTEGKSFPDNSLIVGSPARAIRALDQDAIERLRWSARHYIDNWRRFASGLKRID